MQLNEVQLELALDLYRAGVEQPSHMLLATAHNLVSEGWTKGIALVNPIEAAYPVDAEESDGIPDPRLNRPPSVEAKMSPIISKRLVSEGGVQWNSEWVNPNNTNIPDKGIQRKWSGWQGLNENQKWVMQYFCGEKGHYTLGVRTVIAYAKKSGGYKGNKETRGWVKPHYLMHSMSRRGLVTEIDKDVWILTLRGQLFVREFLGMEPTGKADGVSSVA